MCPKVCSFFKLHIDLLEYCFRLQVKLSSCVVTLLHGLDTDLVLRVAHVSSRSPLHRMAHGMSTQIIHAHQWQSPGWYSARGAMSHIPRWVDTFPNVFQILWSTSHVDVLGNELADSSAERGLNVSIVGRDSRCE